MCWKVEGEASRRPFYPFNGDQVLFMINLFGATEPAFTVEDGRKIEEDIHLRLPLKNQSEISVLAILKELNPSSRQKERGYIHYSKSEFPNTDRSLTSEEGQVGKTEIQPDGVFG